MLLSIILKILPVFYQEQILFQGDKMFEYDVPVESFREKISEQIRKNRFFSYKIIGYSHCKRKIESFTFGEKGKKILLAGCFHGLEWITYLVLVKFMEEIIEKKFEIKNRITIIPCVNPDGVEISLKGAEYAGIYKNLVKKVGKTEKWQSNARGVDINHNFDAGWKKLRELEKKNDIIGPSNTRYGGEFPESEPETQAIVNLCKSEKFDLAFAFHSQGEEIYWHYGDKTPKESLEIAKKIADLTGYKIGSPEGLAVGGGFKDWFIEKFQKPGFTIEVGKGENPLPLDKFENIYSVLKSTLTTLVSKLN